MAKFIVLFSIIVRISVVPTKYRMSLLWVLQGKFNTSTTVLIVSDPGIFTGIFTSKKVVTKYSKSIGNLLLNHLSSSSFVLKAQGKLYSCPQSALQTSSKIFL